MTDVDHRRLAGDLYNHTWTLIERPQRTPDEDDEMLAFAWEALARASRVACDAMTFDESVAHAREAGAQIVDAEDREQFERTLAELT